MNFQDNHKRLRTILWPRVKERIVHLVSESGSSYVIVEAPSALEPQWDELQMINQRWCCIIPLEEAIKRTAARDNITTSEVSLFLKSRTLRHNSAAD